MRREKSENSGRRQPQRVPPPLRRGAGPLPHDAILQEFPSDAGLLLWKSVRNATLWAALPLEDRTSAFVAGAYARRVSELADVDVDPRLQTSLAVIAEVLRSGAAPEPPRIALGCREIAVWAEEQNAIGTAVEFVQAAALIEDSDPNAAREVARLTRARAEYPRAEIWYLHAVARARRAHDWVCYARAFLGLSSVHLHRGNIPAARKAALRGLRAARRRRLREVEGMAHHDLMALAIRAGKTTKVLHHAEAALDAYGSGHPRLPALAHDVAYHWMSRGYFRAALRVFRSLRGFAAPVDQLYWFASMARAAGGAGEAEAFDAAWEGAHGILAHSAAMPGAAGALVELGDGALNLGDLKRAAAVAHQALALARECGETEHLFAAERLLQSIQGQQELAAAEPIKTRVRSSKHAEALADRLATALPESVAQPV